MSYFTRSVVATAMAFMFTAAHAVTYSNAFDGDISSFGAPDTTSYGQVFNLSSAAQLNSWSFFASSGLAGSLKLIVADWDGANAVGPALYTSADFNYGGGAQTLGFSGINLNLATGDYISYITVSGLAAPASNVLMAGSNSDGGLAGGFTYLNSNGVDPLTLTGWTAPGSWSPPNMRYSATFDTVSSVPEPETYAMLLAGLGVLGWVGKRRRVG